MNKHKVGEYITYKSGENMHSSGTIERVKEEGGQTVYVVAESNGGNGLAEVNESRVMSLLNG